MSGNQPRIYWDTNILLAWLKDEERRIDEISELVKKLHQKEIIAVTSVLTIVEVLESTLSDKAREQLDRLSYSYDNFIFVEVNRKISRTAHDVREHFRSLFPTAPFMSTPDAVHLATAIELGCQSFYTYDGEKDENRIKDGRPALPLLPLSAEAAMKYNLQISKPPTAAVNLFTSQGVPIDGQV